jgi:hypothetical protein
MTSRSTQAALWIGALTRRKAARFSALFFLAAVPQTILLAVVPLEAFRVLGSARAVSLLYLAVSFAGLAGRLGIPSLIRLVRRRWVFSLGTLSYAIAAVLLASETPAGLATGLALNVFGAACLEITTNLYVLDHIPRHELSRFEPTRIFVSAGPWTIGPWLGVYLQQTVVPAAPFAIAAAGAVALLALFWSLRLAENTVLQGMRRPPPNPLRYLRRFFSQPRLRLAWALAAGRASWWNMFFIYAPIFAVTSGLGAETGAALVSIGTALAWTVPFWGWLGRRYGLRRLLFAGYLATGTLTVIAASTVSKPWIGAAMLLVATLAAETIDGAGNLLFLRAVHPYERSEMTTVFVSYRDMAQLAPPAVFSVLLSLFSLSSVFVAGGITMLAMTIFTRHIPRRL